MRLATTCVGLAIFLVAPAASAGDKFDSTLDVSVAATNTLVHVDGERMRGQWMAPGAIYRIAMSLEGFRFGAGIGFYGATGPTTQDARGIVWGIPIEAWAGYALGSARSIQPYVDLRVAATHLFGPMGTLRENEMVTAWGFSIMPRVGVRIPIGEYFFSEIAIGVGAGPERAVFSWSFGLPIPTANL